MRKLMMKLMGSCLSAGELTEKKNLVGLTLLEKLQLRMHVKVCGVCEKYSEFSELVDKAVENQMDHSKAKPVLLSDEAKSTILSKLN